MIFCTFGTCRPPQFGARGLGVFLIIFLNFHDFLDIFRNARIANLPEKSPRARYLKFSLGIFLNFHDFLHTSRNPRMANLVENSPIWD